MPPKCNKVKNPCKICLETVTNKSGLQCQGACKKWVHFSCLNYTPGKVNDIKKGIIKISCPCPDCTTTAPKEYLRDEPFSCTNNQCPSNLPQTCISDTCPSNQEGRPLRHCEKDTCKKNKAQTNSAPAGAAAGSCPSSESSSSSGPPTYPRESRHVRGDMGSSQDAGQAMQVVEQICTTVGELANQINRLMNEMKTMLAGRSGDSKPQSSCNQNQQQQGSKSKHCNCPGNQRR